MRNPRLVVLILTFFLIVSPAYAKKGKNKPPPDRSVEFTPVIKKARYSSRPIVEITDRSDEDLKANGFVKIGIAEARMVIQRCIRENGKEKCKDVPMKSDPTAEILREAAKKGGDLLVMIKDREETESFDEGRKCIRWTQDYGYRYVYNYATGTSSLQFGRTQTRCSQYESYTRTHSLVVSLGVVWRNDPELAGKIRQADEFVLAAGSGNIQEVQSFLDRGLDINKTTDSDGTLALSMAALKGKLEMVKYLISRGAKINAYDSTASPLYRAVFTGEMDVVQLLLAEGAKVNQKNPLNKRTVVFAAAEGGNTEILQELLKRKAKVNLADESGITPLMLAASAGHTEAARLLINRGAEVGRQTAIRSRNVGKWTALHFAAFNGQPGMIRVLLEAGANSKKNDNNGNTPQDLAEVMAQTASLLKETDAGSRKLVVNMMTGYSEGLYGYIDRKGTLAVPPRFSNAGTFASGLAPVTIGRRLNKRLGYINRSGKYQIEPEFHLAEPFSEGLAMVGSGGYAYELFGEITWAGMNYGYINSMGQYASGPGFSEARRFSEGLAPVRADGKWKFIDKSGRTVIEGPFEDAWYFTEGLASVKVGGKYGYIDKTGKIIIEPAFAEAGPFFSGRAWFKESDSYGAEHGFIDKKGEVVIKPKFDYPAYFKGDRALVYGGFLGNPFYIDRSGEKVGKWSPSEYSGVKAPYGGEVVSEFSEDLAPVRYKGASFFEYLDSLPE